MRLLIGSLLVVVLAVSPVGAADTKSKTKEPPAVTATRKKLKAVVTADYQDMRLEEVLKDLEKQADGIKFWVNARAGISQNQKITYKAADKPLDKVLDEMFKKYDLGYVIGTKKDGRYEGWIILKKGNARGVEEEDTATASNKKAKDEGDDEKPKAKAKQKARAKPKPADDQPEQVDDPETKAEAKLKLAKQLDDNGRKEAAKERYQEIVKKWPKTKAAKEAKGLLEKLEQ